MPAKIRLWVERDGVHPDQRFYSVEYPPQWDDAAHVRAFADKIVVYNKWVRNLYDALRQGLPEDQLPRFPEELIEKRYRGKGGETLTPEK